MNRRVGHRWSKGEAIRPGRPFLPLTLHQRRRDGRFDDQVLGRWRRVTGGGSARARATVHAGVIQENPYPLSRERCQLLLHLALKKLSSSPPPLAFFINCSFASASASSVLTFSDDVNTRQPMYASSVPDTLDPRNWSYASHWMLNWYANDQPLRQQKHLLTKHL